MYDLKAIIEANTKDGVIDYDKVMANVDSDYVNPIVAKKTDKSKLLPEAVAEVVKGLGIDGESIEDLKSYVKTISDTATDKDKALLAITKERDELKTNYETELETRTKLENETKLSKQMGTIKSLGVNDPDELEFLHFKFNKQVTEEKDFDSVVAEYAKDNGVKTTIKYVKDDFSGGGGNTVDIGAAFKAKREAQGYKTK